MALDPVTGQETDPFAPFRLGDAMAGAVPMPGTAQTIEEMIRAPIPQATDMPSLRLAPGDTVPAPPMLVPPSEPAAPTLSPALPAPPPVEAGSDPAAGLAAALKVGPDVRTTGISRASQNKIRAAFGKMGDVDKKRGDVIDRGTQLAEEKANEISLDEETARLDRAAQEELARQERTKIDGNIVELKDTAKNLRSKHAKDYEKGFFEEKGAAKTWLAAISVGLGAFAASMNRTPNYAWNILEKFMDDHASRERARLQRQKDEIERVGGDVTEAVRALRDYDTITRPQQEAALLRRGAERRSALLARYGADEARINGDQLKLNMEQQAALREADLEKSIASTVVVDNSEQNKLRRMAALPGAGKAPTEGDKKGAATIGGGLVALERGLANTTEISKKDKAIFRKIENEARTIKESDPGKAWSAFGQIAGRYYDQLTPNGSRRLRGFENYFRDLERNTSGAIIGPSETMGHIAEAIEPGGVKYALDRARKFARFAGGAQGEVERELDSFEQRFAGGGQAPARPGAAARSGPSPAAAAAASRATAVQLLRSSNISDLHKRALEQIRDNPNDPRSAKALEKIRSAY